MVSRNEQDKMRIDILKLEIFFADLFENCKNKDELAYLRETVCEVAEAIEAEILYDKGWDDE